MACEQSGIVRDAFAARGHDAWSCDIVPAEHNHFVQHIIADVLDILAWGWDLAIFHPPCTYLSYAGMPLWNKPGRAEKREAAMQFFMALWNAPIARVCLENPLGLPGKVFRKPDQIINPFNFGQEQRKRTCLWLRGLPLLQHTNEVEPEKPAGFTKNGRGIYFHWKGKRCGRRRSITFPGIASAMAAQWPAALAQEAAC